MGWVFRNLLLVALLLTCWTSVAYADPKGDIQAAIQKLADNNNYSWSTTAKATAVIGTGESRGPISAQAFHVDITIDGKTNKCTGFTILSVSEFWRWTPPELKHIPYLVVKNDEKTAIRIDSEWKTDTEMMNYVNSYGGHPYYWLGLIARDFEGPAAQLQKFHKSLKNLQQMDGYYTADITPDAADGPLIFLGRILNYRDEGNAGSLATNAKVSIKCWIKDGVLSKFALHVVGYAEQLGIGGTIVTEIKDMGSTAIEIPDGAKAKLGIKRTQRRTQRGHS